VSGRGTKTGWASRGPQSVASSLGGRAGRNSQRGKTVKERAPGHWEERERTQASQPSDKPKAATRGRDGVREQPKQPKFASAKSGHSGMRAAETAYDKKIVSRRSHKREYWQTGFHRDQTDAVTSVMSKAIGAQGRSRDGQTNRGKCRALKARRAGKTMRVKEKSCERGVEDRVWTQRAGIEKQR